MAVEIERKFLVDLKTDPLSFPVSASSADIRQVYLEDKGSGGGRRVRELRKRDGVSYTYTEKKDLRPMVREEVGSAITREEFQKLLRERDPRRSEIIKRRYAFPWNGQYFELDFISSPIRLVVLEAELTDERAQLILPPFVKVIKEVTDDNRFTNASIAAGLCPGYQ